MIFVYDNGDSYSSHVVYFIRDDRSPPDQVEAFLNDCGKFECEKRGKVVAVAAMFDWREPEYCVSLENWWKGQALNEDDPEQVALARRAVTLLELERPFWLKNDAAEKEVET